MHDNNVTVFLQCRRHITRSPFSARVTAGCVTAQFSRDLFPPSKHSRNSTWADTTNGTQHFLTYLFVPLATKNEWRMCTRTVTVTVTVAPLCVGACGGWVGTTDGWMDCLIFFSFVKSSFHPIPKFQSARVCVCVMVCLLCSFPKLQPHTHRIMRKKASEDRLADDLILHAHQETQLLARFDPSTKGKNQQTPTDKDFHGTITIFDISWTSRYHARRFLSDLLIQPFFRYNICTGFFNFDTFSAPARSNLVTLQTTSRDELNPIESNRIKSNYTIWTYLSDGNIIHTVQEDNIAIYTSIIHKTSHPQPQPQPQPTPIRNSHTNQQHVILPEDIRSFHRISSTPQCLYPHTSLYYHITKPWL